MTAKKGQPEGQVASSEAKKDAFSIMGRALKVLAKNWKFFLGIIALYAVLSLITGGLSVVGNLTDIKQNVQQTTGVTPTGITDNLSLFTYMLGAASPFSGAGSGIYMVVFWTVISLAVIWALRQFFAGNKIKLRDSFYKGMYPLVPFLLVLLLICLQLLPAAFAAGVFTIVMGGGLAVLWFEQLLTFVLLAAGLGLSLYWLSSSIFALYIVCLPDVTPMHALTSAKNLVIVQRWSALAKVVFLPIALVVIGGLIMLPFMLLWPAVAGWVFLLVVLAMVPLAHSYMYSLYRSLL